MIDTHCHIYLEQFNNDLREVLKRAVQKGIKHIFMPAINFGSLRQMDQLDFHQIRFYKMAGIHPTEFNDDIKVDEDKLYEICHRKDVFGVGETGLDYHWSTDYIEDQKQSLRLHCRVAKTVDKPVILHNRKSTTDLLDIIEEEQDGSLSGIWHCFNGSYDEGRRALDLGLHLGIGGVLTFKNAGVDKSVANLPAARMVLETDAPYLAPEPKRGKRNEPSFLIYTAEKLAEIKDISRDELEVLTTQTAMDLFRIKRDQFSQSK